MKNKKKSKHTELLVTLSLKLLAYIYKKHLKYDFSINGKWAK